MVIIMPVRSYRLHRAILAAFVALLATPPALAGSDDPPAPRQRVHKSPIVRVVMLEKLFRVDDRQFDRTADVMAYLEGKRPAQVYILACRITSSEDVTTFQREVQRVYPGTGYVSRLEKNALECSWNSSKPPPRST